jgi:transposase
VPSVAEEDDRRLRRERDRLVGERIKHVNRIKVLLAIHGIYYEPLHRERMQRLKQLRTADGRQLSPRLKAEIVRELQRLELVLGMVKTLEAERDAIASAKAKMTHSNAKKFRIWSRSSASGQNLLPHSSVKCPTGLLTIANN